MQEVFLIVYRKLRWLREPNNFWAWMYRLAAREAIRAANRGLSRHKAQLTDEEWNTIRHAQAGPPAENRLLGEVALREIAALPPASRAVLSLHYIEGMEIRAPAALLDIPVGTAKSRLAFGIQRLRERMGMR